MDRPENIFPITALKVGEPAFIVSINARGELARRIRDMGLGSGMPVSVVGYAPLRDPLALRCAEVTIALRRREAKAIMVRHNYLERGQKVLMLKPRLDSRDGANLIASRSFRSFEAYIVVTVVYLGLAVLLRSLLNWIGPRFIFNRR